MFANRLRPGHLILMFALKPPWKKIRHYFTFLEVVEEILELGDEIPERCTSAYQNAFVS